MLGKKQDGSTAQQDGTNSSQLDGDSADPSAKSAPVDKGQKHQQPLSTAQVVDSAEGILKGPKSTDDTPQQVESLEQPGQDGSGHNASHQQAPGAQTDDRASQQQPGHPQEEQAKSLQESGHPHMHDPASMKGLSSRRRAMERQSASLTLPFEQLNFAFHHINYSVPATVSMHDVSIQLLVYHVAVLAILLSLTMTEK